jgi:hypothetical protein
MRTKERQLVAGALVINPWLGFRLAPPRFSCPEEEEESQEEEEENDLEEEEAHGSPSVS